MNKYHILSLFSFSLLFSFHLMTGSGEFIDIKNDGFDYSGHPAYFLQLAILLAIIWGLITAFSLVFRAEQDEKKDRRAAIGAALLLAADFAMSFIMYKDWTWLSIHGMILALAVCMMCVRTGAFGAEEPKSGIKYLPHILAAAAVLIAILGIIRAFSFHDSYFTLAKDLGVLVNSIWRVGEDGTQFTFFDGYRDQRGAHFQPVIYFFALLFKINCSPYILLFLQVVFSVFAVIFLYLLSEKLLADKKAAFLVSLAFLASPYMARTFVYDFHFDSMYMIMFFAFLYFAELRKFLPAAVVFCLALAVKEEASLYMAVAAVFIYLRNREKKYLALAAGSAVYAVAVIGFLIPSFGSANGSFAGQVIENFMSGFMKYINPYMAAQLAVFFLSAALLPFFAPLALLLLIMPPVAVHSLMYVNTELLLFDVHYASFVAPPLFAALVYGLAKPAAFGEIAEKYKTTAALLVFLLQAQVHMAYMLSESAVYKAAVFIMAAVLVILVFIPFKTKPAVKYGAAACLAVLVFFAGYFTHYKWRLAYVPPEHRQSIKMALSFLPAGNKTAVVTNTNIAPHLCCRKHIFAMELSTPEEILAYLGRDGVREFYLLAYIKDFTYGGINPGDRVKRLFFLANKLGYKLLPLFGDGTAAVARLSRQ